MTSPLRLYPAAPFDRVKEILRLVNLLRQLDQPLTTAEGLRQAIEVALEFAELAGLDQAWIDRLRAIAADPTTFNLLLALVQFVDGLLERHEQAQRGRAAVPAQLAAASQHQAMAAAQEFSDWLPVIVQLVALFRQTRSANRAA